MVTKRSPRIAAAAPAVSCAGKVAGAAAAVAILLIGSPVAGQEMPLPIIDMHLHAVAISDWGVGGSTRIELHRNARVHTRYGKT